MAKPWYVGDVAKVTVTFTVNGTVTDPTAVSLLVQNPAGTTATYTTSTGLTKTSTGVYYKNLTLDSEGTWYWRWVGTSPAAAADEGEIVVKPSVFV